MSHNGHIIVDTCNRLKVLRYEYFNELTNSDLKEILEELVLNEQLYNIRPVETFSSDDLIWYMRAWSDRKYPNRLNI